MLNGFIFMSSPREIQTLKIYNKSNMIKKKHAIVLFEF